MQQVVDEVARARDEALTTRLECLLQDRGIHPRHIGRSERVEHEIDCEPRLLTLGGGSVCRIHQLLHPVHRGQITIGQRPEGWVRLPCPVSKPIVARSNRVGLSPAKCTPGRTRRHCGLPGREIQTGLGDVQRVTHRVIDEHAAQGSSEVALVHLGEQHLIGRVLAHLVAHKPIT